MIRVIILFLFIASSCGNYSSQELYNETNYIYKETKADPGYGKEEVFEFRKNKRYTFSKIYDGSDKIMYSRFMKDNMLNGISRSYTTQGKIDLQTEYKNGVKEGLTIRYNGSGDTIECITFHNGIMTKKGCN